MAAIDHATDDDDDNGKSTRWSSILRSSSKRLPVLMVAAAACATIFSIQKLSSASSPSTSLSLVGQRQKQQQQQMIVIPPCDDSPWRDDEDLMGTCPGDLLKPFIVTSTSSSTTTPDRIESAIECAKYCCNRPDCVSWQFRSDKGCLHGPDVRIGQEKDGPPEYCSDHPPFRWQGQYITDRLTDCSDKTWQPDSQPGQCFGLGDVRDPLNIQTAQQCMERCCSDPTCKAWQFQHELGCFYGGGMHSCQPSDDPIVFQPFVGRRKTRPDRTYTDKDGSPALSWSKKFSST